MEYLPIFLDLRDAPCLVVGGGEVAARKVSLLLEAKARVTVVAPGLCPTLAEQAAAGRISHRAERFAPGHLADVSLAIAATDDREVNRHVSEEARRRRIPVNVVDDPEFCSFIMPAIVDRSPVVIAVSTGGASPVLARLMRARLETLIPATYGRLAALVDRFRDAVKSKLPQPARRPFWEKVLQGPIAEMVLSGRQAEAEDALRKEIEEGKPAETGEVYLVGGGPGNPDLLTFRALKLMQQADVVLHDALVSPEVLNLVRRDAERVYVGKQRDFHTLRQHEINDLLVKLAREGKRVLRLKGGDPFIFGRGGEEIETLAAQGIRFEVVPGITAASGVAAYAGIPLTHRDCAQSCVFVTGHLRDNTINLDWEGLVRPDQTIVIYMGLHGLDILCRELIAHGQSRLTPAAIIQQGTTVNQKVVTGTLEDLPRLAAEARLHPPTLIIVGEVVRLREKLAWFDRAG
jgi:uroporphyrin-III C-methyltransferase/precorrin-2 dehydrogenase/sirohydrochlorin ferrochelatase